MTRTSTRDELERLQAADPLPDRAADGAPPDQVLAAIRRQISQAPDNAPVIRRRPVRRRTVALAVAGLIASATVAHAVWNGSETLSIGCVINDELYVISAVSSDPVADCVAQAASAGEGLDPATLTTFETAEGVVIVAPDEPIADDVAMGGVSPAPDLRIATDLVELRMALDDLITGVAGCSDVDAMKDDARAIADRLGFGHWEVTERERPVGAACGWAFADPQERQIVLVYEHSDPADAGQDAVESGFDSPMPEPDPTLDSEGDVDAAVSLYAEILEVSQTIHDTVDGSCLSAAEAEDMVRRAVATTSHAGTVQITTNEDPIADCARVYTNAYGRYEVTIFGP